MPTANGVQTFYADRIRGRVSPDRIDLRGQPPFGHWLVVAAAFLLLGAIGFTGATRFGSSLAARLLVGVPSLGVGLVCVGMAFGADELTLDRVENVFTYRANGGYVLHRFSLNRVSPPEVRSRTYSTRSREITSHFLYFDHLEATTFVFDGHAAEDLGQVAAAVKAFLDANNRRSS